MGPFDVKILVVEDDLFCRSIMKDILVRSGCSVEIAVDGREALEFCRNEHFPIVITDLVMPVMDGLELCRAIRSRPTDDYVFILLMTSSEERDQLIAGFEAGADEFIVKPVHEIELLARLKAAERILSLEKTLKALAMHDQLTGAYNRGYLDRQLTKEIKRSRRYARPLSLIICDLDYFKSVNDRYGHHAGDLVLKEFVCRINSTIRCENDWLARYGGEEFVIVLPETGSEGCRVVVERIRRLIAETPMNAGDREISITASYGAVSIADTSQSSAFTMTDILSKADECLYKAKDTGRNRIVALQV